MHFQACLPSLSPSDHFDKLALKYRQYGVYIFLMLSSDYFHLTRLVRVFIKLSKDNENCSKYTNMGTHVKQMSR